MITVSTLLMLLVCVFFGLAAFSCPAPPRLNWLGLGLFVWALKVLLLGLS